jgi:hypothetical protein
MKKINFLAVPVCGAGFFHVGVEVFEKEWFYRQSDEEGESGIAVSQPMTHAAHVYRQTFYLGCIE